MPRLSIYIHQELCDAADSFDPTISRSVKVQEGLVLWLAHGGRVRPAEVVAAEVEIERAKRYPSERRIAELLHAIATRSCSRYLARRRQ